MNQDALLEAARQLVALHSDPEPELVTWHAACGAAVSRMRDAMGERSNDGTTTIDVVGDRVVLSFGIAGEVPALVLSVTAKQATKIALGVLSRSMPLLRKTQLTAVGEAFLGLLQSSHQRGRR